jgi:UDP-arabinose 4-epimerase
MKMTRQVVLVTGGAGYIGSHSCKALAAVGYTPIVYDNLVNGHREAVRWGPFVEGDLADLPRLVATMRDFRVSAIMHFAAYAYVGESVRDPRKYFHNNVVSALSLLDAMREVGVSRIVFSSTCATYGIPDIVPITEAAPQRPVNPYGDTKLTIERALYWYSHAYGIRACALRYFNAAGADPDGEIGERHEPETHLIPLALEAALGRTPYVEVFGSDYPTADGTAIRDYIHVQDLARAHVRALQYLIAGGASIAVNLGTGQGHSVRAVLKEVELVTGRQVPRRDGERRAGDPPELVADAQYASRVLGWRAEVSDLPNIVRTAWAWHSGSKMQLARNSHTI